MHQCLIIHGGETFDTQEQYYAFLESREVDPRQKGGKKRKDRLSHAISHEYEVFMPEMPCKQQATYKARKIWFEKYLPYLGNEKLVLIGYSLGGWFLCKWLAENTFPRPITQLHLVATPMMSEGIEGEGSADFDYDYAKLSHLAQQSEEIFIYHSRDDEVVPHTQAELLKSFLPTAELLMFETRNHFFQPALPELLEKMRVYNV